MTVITSKSRESALRRKAARLGYRVIKSRREVSADNLGGYMLVNSAGNYVVACSSFDLNLDDVEALLDN